MNLSIVLLVAANLLPIVGVVFWGWDAFVLLMLYWLETAIVGFWTAARIVVSPTAVDVNGKRLDGMSLTGRVAVAAFITVHAGIFMIVHFVFLWALFSGEWADRIHGPGDFVREMVVGTDLWIPLALLFVVRGAPVVGPPIRRRLGMIVPESADRPSAENPVLGLYVRIFVMQATIIIGAWFAILAGDSIAPLVLLVVLKTVVEVFYDAIMRRAEAGEAKAGG